MNFTGAQKTAIKSRDPRIAVAAGAGSGKTRVLVERIIRLLREERIPLEAIVAITFTEKAAAEMKARLRKAFRANADENDPESVTYWRQLERRLPAARISTIHSFCAGLLRENALDAGLDPDFKVLAEAEGLLLRRRVAAETVTALLNREDPDAVAAAVELGVTRLINQMVLWLGRTPLLARAVAGLPMTDPPALATAWRDRVDAEWRTRLARLPKSRAVGMWLELLKRHEGDCSSPQDKREQQRCTQIAALENLQRAQTVDAIAALLEPLTTGDVRGAKRANWREGSIEPLDKTIKGVRDWAREFAAPEYDDALELAAATLTCQVHRVYEEVVRAYDATKRTLPGLDFDDLIGAAQRLLAERPATCARAAAGMRHLLIDEFQDTDGVQLAIAEQLAAVPGGPHLFTVGDAKQSIYRFRGAEVEIFTNIIQRAQTPITMAENFRTCAPILGFVNAFFQRSRLLEAVEPTYGALEPMRPADATDPRVTVLLPPTEELRAPERRAAEAGLLAAHLRGLLDDGVARIPASDDSLRPVRPADIAILLRARTNVPIYEEALRSAGIPYQIVAGAGFYEKAEVRDFVNLLRIVADPWDEPALFAFLRGPVIALCDDDLFWLAQAGLARAFNREDVPEQMQAPELLARARTLCADLRALQHGTLSVFVRRALELSALEAIYLAQYHGVRKAANLRKLVDLADQLSRQGLGDLPAFLQYVEAVQLDQIREPEAGLPAEEAGAVQLMSVHVSKGLEYPIVCVADCGAEVADGSRSDPYRLHRALGLVMRIRGEDGEMQSPALATAIKLRECEEELAEHARILYVALTRARDHLVISGSVPAARDSWLAELDQLFPVQDAAHGHVFWGEGWRARLVREIDAPRATGATGAAPAALDADALRRQAEPLVPRPEPRRIVSVSAVLDLRFPETATQTHAHHVPRDFARGVSPLLRGSILHAALEHWRAGAEPLALLRDAATAMGVFGPDAAVVVDDLSAPLARFAASRWGQRLAQDKDARRELPFYVRAGTALLSGTLDVLFGDDTVLDYKTGQPSAEKLTRYTWQLRLYAAAVQAITGRCPAQGVVYFVEPDEEHSVAISPAEADAALAEAAALIAGLAGEPDDTRTADDL